MNLEKRHLYIVLTASVALVAHDVSGQAAMTDEGTFVVERNGIAIATETFTIQSSGFGANQRVIARGTLEMSTSDDQTTIRTALLTNGPEFSLSGYELTVTGVEALGMRMELRGERFHADVTTATSTREREFRARIGGQSVVVLDPLLPHHYYFLGRLAASGVPTPLSVIAPRDLTQDSATLWVVGAETIQIDSQSVAVQHLTLTVGDVPHEIWVDLQNRVIRVEVPSLGLRATRRSPPAN